MIKRKKNKKINGLSREDEIWLVFDVDDFLKQNPKKFESAIKNAEEHGLKIAWSNECFELWFLLHFQCVDSNIPRKNYHTQLSKNLKKLSFDYSKNRNIKTLFEICKRLEENAVKNATKIDEGKISKNPSTKIYELIKKLNE